MSKTGKGKGAQDEGRKRVRDQVNKGEVHMEEWMMDGDKREGKGAM